MTSLVISAASTEYVQVPVAADVNGSAVDPTSLTVSMGFGLTDAQPTYVAASWDTDDRTNPPTYRAQCLVGPDGGAAELEAGLYRVWVKVADSPETVVRQVGLLRVV